MKEIDTKNSNVLRRLEMHEVLKDGATIEARLIDFEKEPETKRLFEETAKRQQMLIELRDQPFENLTVTL